jgi:alpha-tubulin suppressor-like RCC1 family protein
MILGSHYNIQVDKRQNMFFVYGGEHIFPTAKPIQYQPHDINQPIFQVDFFKKDLAQVACGNNFVFFLTTSQQVFSCGAK